LVLVQFANLTKFFIVILIHKTDFYALCFGYWA